MVSRVKNSTFLIFKVIILCQISRILKIFFERKQKQKTENNFYYWQILITFILNILYCAQFLTFDTKLDQIPREFSATFGLAYSTLNSANFSCSSKVTLPNMHTISYLVLSVQYKNSVRKSANNEKGFSLHKHLFTSFNLFFRFLLFKNAAASMVGCFNSIFPPIPCGPAMMSRRKLSGEKRLNN